VGVAKSSFKLRSKVPAGSAPKFRQSIVEVETESVRPEETE